MELLYFLVVIYHQLHITMEQLEYIIMDGVISAMMSIIIQWKLMSFVISWDTLELQATQELDLSGGYWPLSIIYKNAISVVMVQTTFL